MDWTTSRSLDANPQAGCLPIDCNSLARAIPESRMVLLSGKDSSTGGQAPSSSSLAMSWALMEVSLVPELVPLEGGN